MGAVRNILFVMCDQLRRDYLSCAGHPTLETPAIDALAARGVRFTRAFVQSPVCGPSRMSFYTGRYMASHGATWNGVPLTAAEWTLGDYLRPLGVRTALAGKTHMAADADGMARLAVDPVSELGVLVSECGFEPYARHDGLRGDDGPGTDIAYDAYLRSLGYNEANPWLDLANSAEGPDGALLSGWHMRHAGRPARVPDEHSETAWTTDRAIDFIDAAGDAPWCLHLSYIKPHWPYIVSAPYHAMYGADDVVPAVRSEVERAAPHPVYAAFMQHEDSVNFARDEVRAAVVPAYMGLVRQIDDHFGRLMTILETRGRLDDTLIVFTSDHGDYLGDHWLGEKDLFHDVSAQVPLIVYDPDAAADATRGTTDDRFVEAIDLVPTFIEAVGGDWRAHDHRLEGRSILGLARGAAPAGWRDAVFSEYDGAFRGARATLGLGAENARMWMIRTARWKYVVHDAFHPQLYDLADDPDEFVDLGASDAHAGVRAELDARLFQWLRRRKVRTTVSNERVIEMSGSAKARGIHIGVW